LALVATRAAPALARGLDPHWRIAPLRAAPALARGLDQLAWAS
jgi:hypothetical protein